jgi:hypothetical protein
MKRVLPRLPFRERLARKRKSFLDLVKDWGGVASLVIAIGYSFPLGIWEKFIQAEQQRTAAEVKSLRSVIEETVSILTEGTRTLSATQDPFLYDTAARAINTRIFLQMAKHREMFEKHRNELTPPELLVIGNNYTMTGQPELALPFFSAAEEKAKTDMQSRYEAMRQRAKIRFSPGPLQDRPESRKSFQTAVAAMAQTPSLRFASVSLLSEWALFELLDGDWSCGQQKLAEAKRTLEDLAPYMNDNGNFLRLITQRTQALNIKVGQPSVGCQ